MYIMGDLLSMDGATLMNLVEFTKLPQSHLLGQEPWMLPKECEDSDKVNKILGSKIP